MKKKITLLVCAFLAAAMLFGACANQQPNQSANPSASGQPATSSDSVIVGEIDGQSVYKSEFEKWLNLNGYGSAVLEDASYASYIPEFLDYFMGEKVTDAEIEKRGYLKNLTSDQITQAQQNAQADIDYSVQNYDMTEEQVLTTIGMTKDELVDQYKIKAAGDAAYTELVGNVKPTDDQIKKEYDSTVTSQKEAMDADPKVYVSNVNSGTEVYYAPTGVRTIKKLLIAIDSKTSDAILTLRDSDFNDQADVLLNDALLKIKSKADEVKNKLKSGLSFNDAMAQYNEDKEAPEGGYPVVAGATDYSDTFTEKAMALTSLGQVSDMFSTDEGYQIIEYTSNVTPGAASFESVKDKVSNSLLAQIQTDAWTAMVDQWKKDHNVKTFAENL